MADDFLPVGIKAVAQGVDNFVNQLGRMQTAYVNLIRVTNNSSTGLQQQTRAANATQRAMRQLSAAQTEASTTASNYTRNVSRINAVVGQSVREILGQQSAFARNSQAAKSSSQAFAEYKRQQKEVGINTNSASAMLARQRAELSRLQGVSEQLRAKIAMLARAESLLAKETQNMAQKEQAARNQHAQTAKTLSEKQQRLRILKAQEEVYIAKLKEARQAGSQNEAAVKAQSAVLKRNRQAQRELTEEIKGYKNASDTSKAAVNSLSEAHKKARQSYLNTKKALDIVTNELKENQQATTATQIKIKALSAAITAVRGPANVAKAAISGVTKAIGAMRSAASSALAPLRALNAGFQGGIGFLRKMNSALGTAAGKAFRMGNSIRFLGTSLTFIISLPIIGFLGGLTKGAIEFEEAFAGIIRTVDQADFRLLPENETNIRNLTELGEQLRDRIRKLGLEIPVATAELAKLGEVAGTLGVRGVGNIVKFVDITAKLGLTTNVTAEEAARGLGKIIAVADGITDAELSLMGFTDAQIAGMTSSQRFQKTLDLLGGSLVALGNKLPATEAEILNFALEIAGTADVAGISANQLLGIAAAFQSVGIAASRGRTAFQKTIFNMLEATQSGVEEIELFATLAGETAESFGELFERDAAEAFRVFIRGLQASGRDGIKVLENLGLANERTRAALLQLAASEGKVTEALNITTEELLAQVEGLSALELEAARRASTTQSQMQLLRNQFTDLGITIGTFVLPMINDFVTRLRGLIEAVADLDPKILKLGIAILGVIAIVGPLLTIFGTLLASIGLVGIAVTWFIGGILSLASTAGILIIPILGVIAALAGLGIALAASITNMRKTAEDGFGSLASNMFQFGKNIILSFAKGMARAAAAVITVLNSIGKAIAYWLRPGSPPKLLPDLDAWGTAAMQSYLDGWSKADFDIFNKIADKIEQYIRAFNKAADDAGRKVMIELILGTRKQIRDIVNEFKKTGRVASSSIKAVMSAAKAGRKEVRGYIKALLDLELASAKVEKIQDKLAETNRKYAASLKPLNARLAEIAKRQDEIARKDRRIELEAVLADPRAPEVVRELANLELEQLDLEGSVSELEAQRDAEVQILETRLEAAQLELDAAQERFDAAEALLDVLIKERELMNELEGSAEKIKKGIEDALGGLDLGDLGALDIGTPDEFDLGDALMDSVSSIVEEINEEFTGLFADIKAIFAPLGELWDELGETWSGIFEAIFGPIENLFGIKIRNPFEKWTMPSDIQRMFGDDPRGPKFLREMLEGGEIPPLFTDQHFTDIRAFGDELTGKLQNGIGTLLKKITELRIKLEPVIKFLGALKDAFVDAFKNIEIQGLIDAWNEFRDTMETSGAADFFRGLANLLGGVLTVALGIVVGLIQGVIRAIEFMLPFFGAFLGGIAAIGAGIVNFVGGIIDAIQGVEGAGDRVLEGLRQIFGGIGQTFLAFFGGIFSGILGLVAGFGQGFFSFLTRFAAAMDEKWSGMWAAVFARAKMFWDNIVNNAREFINSIIEFFTNLYNELVGNSIVVDLINSLFEWFGKLFEIPAMIAEFVANAVIEFLKFTSETITGITEWIGDLKIKFTELAGKALGWLVDVGKNVVQGLVNGISGGAQLVRDAVSGLANLIPGPIKDILGISSPSRELEEIGQNSIDGLVSGLEKSRAAVAKIMESISEIIVKGTERALEGLVNISGDSLEAFLKVVLKASTTFGEIWTDTADTFLDTSEQMWQSWIEPVVPLLTQFLEAFENAMMKWVVSGPGSLWGTATKVFLELSKETFSVSWKKLLVKAMEMFLKWFEDMILAMESQKGRFKGAGRDLMSGFLSGIQSMRGAIMNAARSIAEEAASIVNSALGNASPSKVFAEIGQNLMLGWIKGVENMEPRLMAAMRAIASDVLAASPQALPAQASAPVVVLPPSSSSGKTTINDINFDLGGQTIQNGMDAFELQILVEQAVRNALR